MLGYGKFSFTDYYLHYKKKYYDDCLVHEIKPDGNRFYAKDYVDFREQNVQEQVSLRGQKFLTIMTPTMYDFEVDDYVINFKTKEKWRVNSVTISDDGQMKRYSSRPRKVTILELVR